MGVPYLPLPLWRTRKTVRDVFIELCDNESNPKVFELRKLQIENLELKLNNKYTSLQQFIKGFIAGLGLALAVVGFVLRVLINKRSYLTII